MLLSEDVVKLIAGEAVLYLFGVSAMGAIRKLFGLTVLGYGATMEDFREFLLGCNDDTGKPITIEWIHNFDSRKITKKPLEEALAELNRKEIVFFRHPESGRVVRRAHSVWIILRNPTKCMELVEVGHFYHNNYELKGGLRYKRSDRSFSYSETIILGESWEKTVIRCLEQEAHLQRIDLIRRKGCSRIEPLLEVDGKILRQENLHESSAYPGFMSYQEIRVVCYVFTEKYSPRHPPPTVIDNGKYTVHEWKPCPPISETARKTGSRRKFRRFRHAN